MPRTKYRLLLNQAGVWGSDSSDACSSIVLRSTEVSVDGHWKVDSPAERCLTAVEKGIGALRHGDLVVTKSSGSARHIGKTALVSPDIAEIGAYHSNFMQRLRADSRLHSGYVYYLLNSRFGRERLRYLSLNSMAIRNLTGTMLGEISIPVDDCLLQNRIATFLDRETERIDALIDKKRRLINLLEEKRTATITQAVTKGLDSAAPMKPSNIPWIGDIPEHWHIGQLKHVIDEIQTGPFGSQVHNADYIYDGIPLVNPTNIRYDTIVADREVSVSETKANELARHRLAEHDMVLSRRGEMGRCALVTKEEAGWLCGTGSMRLRVTSGINPRYLTHLIRSIPMTEYFGLHSVGSTMDNLSATTVGEAPVTLPPTDEQDEIAFEIDRVVGGTLEATGCLNTQLTLLAEYREALITAAVTGEIDVDTFDNGHNLEAATA